MTPSTIPDLRAHPLIDIEFEDIDDEALRTKARYLREFLPELPILFIYYALMTFTKDANITAAALLMDEPPVEFRSNIAKLKEQFPNSQKHQARDVLIAEKGDYDAAEQRLRIELAMDNATADTLLHKEMALDQVGAEIPIPPENEHLKNAARSPPRHVTSAAKTTHINGVIHSFQVSTKTHMTSAVNSKPAGMHGGWHADKPPIDLTGRSDDESPPTSSLKQFSTPPLSFVKKEDTDTLANDTSKPSAKQVIVQIV